MLSANNLAYRNLLAAINNLNGLPRFRCDFINGLLLILHAYEYIRHIQDKTEVIVHTNPDTPAINGATSHQPYRILAGIGVSGVVHALLLFSLRNMVMPSTADEPTSFSPLKVWVRPLPPLPRSSEIIKTDDIKKLAAPVERARRKPALRVRGAVRGPTTFIEPVARAPSAVMLQDSPERRDYAGDAAPRFDLEAARKTARKFANEPDPARVGTAVGQIAPQPLRLETQLARDIARGKRRDCKDGMPGGVLGPILILFDKKDSGCKL